MSYSTVGELTHRQPCHLNYLPLIGAFEFFVYVALLLKSPFVTVFSWVVSLFLLILIFITLDSRCMCCVAQASCTLTQCYSFASYMYNMLCHSLLFCFVRFQKFCEM